MNEFKGTIAWTFGLTLAVVVAIEVAVWLALP
jgi:hypothetical protein